MDQNINQDTQSVNAVQNNTVYSNQQPYQGNVNQQPQQNNKIPEEYKPIGAWAYFGYELLFAIPLVGFILLLVFALGGTRNINLRNFSRSYFCFMLVGVIIGLFVLVILILTGTLASIAGSSAATSSYYY